MKQQHLTTQQQSQKHTSQYHQQQTIMGYTKEFVEFSIRYIVLIHNYHEKYLINYCEI